jgi:hypothetical protein
MVEGRNETNGQAEEPEVVELTPAEWQEAVVQGLRRVGVTRAELQAQAKEKNFISTEARKLWMIIGDPA